MAAQSLVRLSYELPIETFGVNVMGTVHLLQAIKRVPSVRAAVIVTSDKCYENLGAGKPYKETDPMGGSDPYSASKGCAEIVVASLRTSAAAIEPQGSGIAIASARSGNVVGGGDWSSDRLVPDCIRSFVAGIPVKLRHPEAVRPWLHGLDPLFGYVSLAEQLVGGHSERFATAFNFGPGPDNDADVLRVAQTVADLWGHQARVETVGGPHPPEAALLRLDATKASRLLNWQARWNITKALEQAVEWYKAWHKGGDVRSIMIRQLADFTAAAGK